MPAARTQKRFATRAGPLIIDPMTVTVTTDPARIDAVLTRLLAADPVRSTVLGSILADLRSGSAPAAWCAVRDGSDAVALRSAPSYPALFSQGWAGRDLDAVIELLRDFPDLVGVSGAADAVEVAAAALAEGRDRHRMALRLFRLDSLTEPPAVAGEPRAAATADREVIVAWYRAFRVEAGGLGTDIERIADRTLAYGRIWLWCLDGRPVSLAARRAPESGSARVGPVYTPPEQRGHGYGSAVTAAATRDILDLDAVPVLFTDLANPTSNKIYQDLGYYPVEDRLQVTFRR